MINKQRDKRPDWYARTMISIDLMASWSTCQRLQTAAAIVDNDWQTLASGFNGAPRGMPHCNAQAPIREGERCTRCLHAERNTINQAARTGVKIQGANMFTLYRPCIACTNDIVQTGLAAVHYRWDYDTDNAKDDVVAMYKRAGIFLYKQPMCPEEQEFNTDIAEWRRTWVYGSLHIVSE